MAPEDLPESVIRPKNMRRALFLHEDGNGIRPRVEALDEARLSGGDVLVSILYSGVNYKDALAVTGRGKVIRGEYPFIPGIDLVGRVEESASELYRVGDMVIATGWGLGETHWGGYSEVQRLQSARLLPLPEGLSPEGAMIAGTAGFTAMLSVMALEEAGTEPSQGEIVVTGASGGVGSMAIAPWQRDRTRSWRQREARARIITCAASALRES